MFQEKENWSRADIVPPLHGHDLERQLKWQGVFREVLRKNGFEEVRLPTVMPLDLFESRLTGANLLPPGPIFRDTSGVDWALRSDMTTFASQFIRARLHVSDATLAIGYSGQIFSFLGEKSRLGQGSGDFEHGLRHPFLESFEYGAEVVSPTQDDHELQIMDVMLQVAKGFGYPDLLVVVGDSRVSLELEKAFPQERSLLRRALGNRDHGSLSVFCDFELRLQRILRDLQFEERLETLRASFPSVHFVSDPFLLRPQGFYSGFVFELYAVKSATQVERIGAGGSYADLLKHYGYQGSATGFKIADPHVSGLNQEVEQPERVGEESGDGGVQSRPLRIAVPKGRLLSQVFDIFAVLGIEPQCSPDDTRKLVISSRCGGFEFLLVKNGDVPSYLERGVADLGIAGTDVLDESQSAVFRPLTFRFGETRICLAGREEDLERVTGSRHVVVATKYSHIARRELTKLGKTCEVVPLQGSVELAGVLEMSDAIVDLVETGHTLRENNLMEFQELARSRVHLLVSKGLYYQQAERLQKWECILRDRGLLYGQEGVQE